MICHDIGVTQGFDFWFLSVSLLVLPFTQISSNVTKKCSFNMTTIDDMTGVRGRSQCSRSMVRAKCVRLGFLPIDPYEV